MQIHIIKTFLNLEIKMKSNSIKRSRLFPKIILSLFTAIFVIVTISHFVWRASGSNEWKLVKDENGVKVYSLKAPGSTLLKFKADMRVQTRLSSAVFALRGDVSTANDFSGTNFKVIERIETPTLYMATYSVDQVMPPPLGTKEIVMQLHYMQDPETKKVVIHVEAAPGKIPPKKIWRVKHLNNIFSVTPLGNGEVDWQMIMDVDMGVPYFLFNSVVPDSFVKDFAHMKELLETDKYKNAQLMSVQEI